MFLFLPAGIEGLRGLCVPKSVAEDTVPWLMKSTIPPPWQVGAAGPEVDAGT